MSCKNVFSIQCNQELLQSTQQGELQFIGLKLPTSQHFDETQSAIIYFDKVLQTIQKCKFRDSILFDLSEVEIITPDAIMYLIAIIRNTRRIRFLRISCGGNMPKADSARDIIEQSGFFSFVSSTSKLQIEPDNSYMKISDGVDADGELASSFCDFVQSSSTQTVLSTKRLYPMIIELMTNTHQHAYDTQEAQTMMGNWYIFAQDTGTAIHFVFLDTGLGIPKTVLKDSMKKLKTLHSETMPCILNQHCKGRLEVKPSKDTGEKDCLEYMRTHVICQSWV